MDLSFWLTTISLGVLAYAGATWVASTYLASWRASRSASRPALPAPGVKRMRRIGPFKPRSARSERSEPVNARSERQEAKEQPVNVPNVQPTPAPAAPHVPPAGDVASANGGFTLTPGELMSLAEALHLRREGATVEEAVCRAFGVTKGGSAGYVRGKALFDAATALPGAAPAGTYAAPAAPPRRRRAAAR